MRRIRRHRGSTSNNFMPTGYTQKLMESGQSFPDFVLGCARAFGACVTMRDDPQDTPIPEFKPSDFNAKAKVEAEAEIARLEAMTPEERVAYGEEKKAAALAIYRGLLERETAQNARLDVMRDQVEAWTAPTKEHLELKKFMLQQIKVSRHDTSGAVARISELEKQGPEFYYEEALRKARWSVEYHTKSQKEEEDRVAARNEWVRQLKQSIA